MGDNTELYILKALLSDIAYSAKYLDKLEHKFFEEPVGRVIHVIDRFYATYNKIPTIDQITQALLPKYLKNDAESVDACIDVIQQCRALDDVKDFSTWVSDETKTFIKRKKLETAMVDAVNLMEKGNMDEAVARVMKVMEINFDDNLGLDYWEDMKLRMEELRNPATVIPSGLSKLDEAIGGGWRNKSLIIFGAATNVGKTLIMGDLTAKLIDRGYNGLYITLEINEHILANRIDANLTETKMSELTDDVDELYRKISSYRSQREEANKTDPTIPKIGRFIIKEYAPGYLNATAILSLLRELQLKKNFKPDFIVVDYIGLMIPNGKSFADNTYGRMKTVSEELRAVSSLHKIPVFSAVQLNREGYKNNDVGLEKTSDSMGIPMSADVMIMVTRDEEGDNNNIMKWHVAKSRWSRNGSKFAIHVDYDYMRLSDSRETQQESQTKATVEALNEYKAHKNSKGTP